MKLFRVRLIRNDEEAPSSLLFYDFINVVAPDEAMAKAAVEISDKWHSGVEVDELAEVHTIVTEPYNQNSGGYFSETAKIRNLHKV